MSAEPDFETIASDILQDADTNFQKARASRITQWAAAWSEQFRNDSKSIAPESFVASFRDDENSIRNPTPPPAP